MPSFNSIDFLETAVNGDVLQELEMVQPSKPKSDFYVNPPRLKVDDYIKRSIDEANSIVVNSQPNSFETGTDVPVLAASVRTLTEDRRQLTQDRDTVVAQLEEKRSAHAEATRNNEKSRAKDLANEIQIIEAAVKTAEELLKGKDAELKEAEDAFNTAMAGGTGVQSFTKVFLKKANTSIRMLASVPGTPVIPSNYPLKQELLEAGIAGEIGKVSAKIRRSSLDNNIRLLLSNEPLYVYCLYTAVFKDNVRDADGLLNRVMVYIDDVQQGVQCFAANMFFKAKKLDNTQIDKEAFIEQIKVASFSYQAGKPVAYMNSVISSQMKYGNLPKYVDDFFAAGELPAEKNTPEIKKRMVEYLYNLDLQITGTTLPPGKFDEYFANAYAYAAKLGSSEADPVKNIFSDVQVDFFDFKVDYFETVEEQSIDRQNILAAAVLFYNKVLADDLGILRISDAIIMAWTQGKLDIPQGETATKLYRYYKLRKERTTAEERAMFYKIVFNSGNADVLEDSVVNTEFSQLWSTLMNETVKYIQKYESNENANEFVSKVGVYNAIKNLQYNLSVFMSGMVKSLLPEMYAQLQSAIDLLKRPEIVQQLGQGYHRNMWKVIERVSAEAFNYIPNVSALRTIAVKGHSVFHAIANFDEAQFSEEDFRNFISDVEEFIVANGQIEIRDTDEMDEEVEDTKPEKDDWNF